MSMGMVVFDPHSLDAPDLGGETPLFTLEGAVATTDPRSRVFTPNGVESMAIRSNAGTGVIVSLVVFILISIFLLVMAILFYSGQATQMEAAQNAEANLEEFALKRERNSEQFQTIEAAAKKDRESVLGYLLDQNNTLKTYVAGNPDESMENIKRRFSALGVDSTIYNSLKDSSRKATDTQNELDSLRQQAQSLQEERDRLTADVETASRSRDTLLAAESKQMEKYRTATDEHLSQIADVRELMEVETDKLRDRYSDTITELENEVDALRQEKVVLKSRVEDLEGRINKTRIRPHDPDTLVDGTIIDIAGSNDQVYIDRGRQDQVVLGMTFEVYDDAAQIRPTAKGVFPRGKASLQVIKVGDNTSTAKITRSTIGRPVVRNDVIANAIYDPKYKFKFLVHGQYDVDGDGYPSEEEAAYLRSQIENWGGVVVRSDTLPGDLDFLVLGVEPMDPVRPPQDASMLVQQDYIRKKTTYHDYQELYKQARNAQIPILNANRLHILTGGTDL